MKNSQNKHDITPASYSICSSQNKNVAQYGCGKDTVHVFMEFIYFFYAVALVFLFFSFPPSTLSRNLCNSEYIVHLYAFLILHMWAL